MTPERILIDLSAPVASLRHIGSRTAARLGRLGITTVRRLLWHLPSRYEDFRQSTPVDQAAAGQVVTVQGAISDISTRVSWRRRRMTIVTATLEDDTGRMRLVWFNQPYLADTLAAGTVVSVAGKVALDKQGLYLSGPVYEKILVSGGVLRHTGRLVPVYPETDGVTSKFLRFLIQPLLEYGEVADYLPEPLRTRLEFPTLREALAMLHYPERPEDAERARRRLAFDDLLLFQLRALRQRRAEQRLAAPSVPFDRAFMRSFVHGLPWEMTRDQKVALLEILRDMERPFPMNRLLEGDVGSGKTAVALAACAQVIRLGTQAAVLAPTEVLARQHYETARRLLGGTAVRMALMTGSESQVDGVPVPKTRVKLMVARNQVPLVIGTHAVIQKDLAFPALALAVVDEQHRFGITQRSALLRSSGVSDGRSRKVPHLLSMTATPIPRTLALTVFGDLDLSVLRAKPAGRTPVSTAVVLPGERAEMEQFIREEAARGRQVFIICPAIETVNIEQRTKSGRQQMLWAEVKAVTAEHSRLTDEVFPGLKVAMLHGRMKPKEKERVMREFRDGWHDILVATSVVEVGVDVPNATVMVIEGAERFGLAQLHQFRGRVGRREHRSWCFLVPSPDAPASERLEVLVNTDDGFALAEHDLRLRGPGEFFGIRQSGMSDLTMAALADAELVQMARKEARELLRQDPSLKNHPLLARQLERLSQLSHSE